MHVQRIVFLDATSRIHIHFGFDRRKVGCRATAATPPATAAPATARTAARSAGCDRHATRAERHATRRRWRRRTLLANPRSDHRMDLPALAVHLHPAAVA